MADMLPLEPMIQGGLAGRLVALVLLLAAFLLAVTLMLPHNPYIRYQQTASGDFSRVRWVYERIHFDPTPIDVAVIGSSRVEAAISAPNLQQALSRELGKPIHVANLAVPLEGRDTHWVIAQELLKAHPETRMVLLSLVEPIRRSHPAFRNIAQTGDVLRAPFWLNYYWLENAAYLPFRNMSLAVQSAFPRLFGMDPTFNPRHYALHGTDFDTSENFRLDNGALVDRERYRSPEELERTAAARSRSTPSRLARLFGADDNIVEHYYTARLGAQLAERCTKLLLVHMPIYRGNIADVETDWNARVAPVLMTPADIGNVWTDYTDAGHLRRAGIDKVTHWLPQAVKPFLGSLDLGQGCRAGE